MRQSAVLFFLTMCALWLPHSGAAQAPPFAGTYPITVSTSLPSDITAKYPGGASGPEAVQPAGGTFPITVSTALPADITAKYPGGASGPEAIQPAGGTYPISVSTSLPSDITPNQPWAPTDTLQSVVPDVSTNPAAGVSAAKPRAPSRADARMCRKVRMALLRAFPWRPGAKGKAPTGIGRLRVACGNGTVTFRGIVHSRRLKRVVAARVTAMVGTGRKVDDRLVVR